VDVWHTACAPTWSALRWEPAAVYRHGRAADLGGGIGAQEHAHGADLLGRCELARRLLLGQEVDLGPVVGNAVALGARIDLLLHERREDPAGADGVARH